MVNCMTRPPSILKFPGMIVTPPATAPVASRTIWTRPFFKPLHCAPLHQLQQQQEVDARGIMCEPCNGKGWLLCDFCKGQKTNVTAENKRIYRRCPSCKAIGYLLCSKCKVFKCVTFPNCSDGEELTF
ncbi:dnaJ [Gossypium arboreum]|uniref:DnaJ n=5 Tax=Gossypium TaxID=3633 RepID=A0A0B0NWN0_GOSAR|nr:uncharacterized protein LOC107963468 isoform X1 [Gossypium hirsutum]XP_017644943.1 uncharacterized protein LOC108485595 isoform X1 [Gossypium arboreum]TYH13281.1 hypothetical protein ES288_A06G130600v1 [Gossypium darwinii]TYJ30177.1 hypothetical protein E1A91_A06G116800v1 [Gossypium mustelinum]KAG4195366.1 hypothetical protein ERO13_A06G107400v2 [Gossypium hirsutum]KAK5825391.1 hypothetical protein PVK06_020221 [Gossypium arboreum]KHG16259.1 dnaJ [Gossypium arboreum]